MSQTKINKGQVVSDPKSTENDILDLSLGEHLILKMKAHRDLKFGIFVVGLMVLMAVFSLVINLLAL